MVVTLASLMVNNQMENKWTEEATKAANFLAGMPIGSTTLERDDLRSLLYNTGGAMMARGRLYGIKSKYLGAGIYRITLELVNP